MSETQTNVMAIPESVHRARTGPLTTREAELITSIIEPVKSDSLLKRIEEEQQDPERWDGQS